VEDPLADQQAAEMRERKPGEPGADVALRHPPEGDRLERLDDRERRGETCERAVGRQRRDRRAEPLDGSDAPEGRDERTGERPEQRVERVVGEQQRCEGGRERTL
jgi:hypothetical protein